MLSIVGCSTTQQPGLVRMDEPLVKIEKIPDFNFDTLESFSVIPYTELFEDQKPTTIEEKQLLFILRNYLEQLGYQYVQYPAKVDFIATISHYKNEYKQSYIPPSTYTTIKQIPGETKLASINTNSSFSGIYNDDYFSGNSSSNGSLTYQTPDQYIPVTNTIPGGYVGWYFPLVNIEIYDTNHRKEIWNGLGIASANEQDIRKSFNVIGSRLLIGKGATANFPRRNSLGNKSAYNKFGFNIKIFTEDGNNFFPFVADLINKSPAKKAGLRIFDIITGINGQSTLNKSYNQVLEMIQKSSLDNVQFNISRNGKTKELFFGSAVSGAETDSKEIYTTQELWPGHPLPIK